MQVISSAAPARTVLRDAAQYWEPRRLLYNLALTALAGAVVVRTWPHFQPAFTLSSLPPLLVLAALANLCYCAVYGCELLAHGSTLIERWHHWRPALFIAGTLLALATEYYWIVDEIYPAVPFVR